jgi:hypothetical protein
LNIILNLYIEGMKLTAKRNYSIRLLKKTFIVSSLVLSFTGYGQTKDSLLLVLPTLKDEAQRIRLIYRILDNPDPKKGLFYHQKLLDLTRKQNDKAGEAAVTVMIGHREFLAGNSITGNELQFKALKMAEEAESKQALGMAYTMLAYIIPGNSPKRKEYLDQGLDASTAAKDYLFMCYEFSMLIDYYTAKGKLDSALHFSQRFIELATAHHLEETLPMGMVYAGKINYLLGHKGLALEYYRAALRELNITGGERKENADDIGVVYSALSDFYRSEDNPDSALYYAKLNYHVVQEISYLYQMRPLYRLWKAYEKTNPDSALKYATAYYAIKDSIHSIAKTQQIQIQAMEEDDRQRKVNEDRKANLQYGIIALGLILLLIGYLVLSHSVIANQKLIQYLGVVSLLMVFEFLNLVLHPHIGRLTHHSPLLMLLIMVCVAALLVPLHHKLEHWITHKLVEKNKKIRLVAAKRTIAKLEGEERKISMGKSTDAQQEL